MTAYAGGLACSEWLSVVVWLRLVVPQQEECEVSAGFSTVQSLLSTNHKTAGRNAKEQNYLFCICISAKGLAQRKIVLGGVIKSVIFLLWLTPASPLHVILSKNEMPRKEAWVCLYFTKWKGAITSPEMDCCYLSSFYPHILSVCFCSLSPAELKKRLPVCTDKTNAGMSLLKAYNS